MRSYNESLAYTHKKEFNNAIRYKIDINSKSILLSCTRNNYIENKTLISSRCSIPRDISMKDREDLYSEIGKILYRETEKSSK